VPLPEAPNLGEPLPALFPNSGESLQSMQSEETVAIWQHLQTTDSDNFDVLVEEYIIQEHNDDEISSDDTVAWERNIRHLHHITVLLTTCPADLPVNPNQALPVAQSAYHTHLATQESVFRPASHLRFHTEHATQAPPSSTIGGRTGVMADRDKIEFRLFNSSSIFNITLREELFSLPKQNLNSILSRSVVTPVSPTNKPWGPVPSIKNQTLHYKKDILPLFGALRGIVLGPRSGHGVSRAFPLALIHTDAQQQFWCACRSSTIKVY